MKIAVVIPSFRVRKQILQVLSAIGPEVSRIFVVDDKCPENSGSFVRENCRDPRVQVIFQKENSGVGGATLRGFLEASAQGYQVAVKLDGDGQMDPKLIPLLVRPILEGKADYTKGNRFHSPRNLKGMPTTRLLGNAGLSFFAKMATGYWNVMDPTNGFLALHTSLLPHLDADKIAQRYFFENDLLFRLGLCRAVVTDMPMRAHYGEEKSNLSVVNSLITFPFRLLLRFLKRMIYRYFLRDFNIGSVLILMGGFLFASGSIFGAYHWILSAVTGQVASSGAVMISALPILLGFQMLGFALLFDVWMTPREPVHPYFAAEAQAETSP